MKIFDDINEWKNFRSHLSPDFTLGFVPTMGNLHAGHASLLSKSIHENNTTVSSLFINPTQFNRNEDFQHYPRTLEADLQYMEQIGVDYCILPNETAIYPDQYHYQVHETNLTRIMEGTHRPGHFTGVLTVVMKLLNLVRPTNAYFGEKDYQQYLLIKEMVQAFFMPIEIKSCPIIREDSGLACSSRNNRLSNEQKIKAKQFAKIFHQNKPCEMIRAELEKIGITVEYIEEFLNRRFIAVSIGDIRLIDNYLLT